MNVYPQGKEYYYSFSFLFELFITFIKISPLTFGGGLAIIPHIESVMVEKKNWFVKDDIPRIVTIAQSTPGSIAINAAIYIGFSLRGLSGAVASMLGLLFPSTLIVTLLTYLVLTYHDPAIIQEAFKGIRPAIVGLIFFAAFKIGRIALQDRLTVLVFISAIGLLAVLDTSPLFLIAGGILIGWISYTYRCKRR
ncbi:chromate transporter [Halobacillus andaensis]|uniref:chromate transporter n=1 Tax=Halobacillus andaensis TaxID=1176239 RepID=UPI003D7519B7